MEGPAFFMVTFHTRGRFHGRCFFVVTFHTRGRFHGRSEVLSDLIFRDGRYPYDLLLGAAKP